MSVQQRVDAAELQSSAAPISRLPRPLLGKVSRRVVAVSAGRIPGDHRIVVEPAVKIRLNRTLCFVSAVILGGAHRKSRTHLRPNAAEEIGQGFSQRLDIVTHRLKAI